MIVQEEHNKDYTTEVDNQMWQWMTAYDIEALLPDGGGGGSSRGGGGDGGGAMVRPKAPAPRRGRKRKASKNVPMG